MIRIFLSWLLLWPLLLGASARADTVALDPQIQGELLGYYLEYQVDSDGKAGVEQMRQRTGWQPVAEKVPNLGLGAPVHWFRLDVQVADLVQPWLVEIDYSQIDRLDLYLLDDAGRVLDHRERGMIPKLPDHEVQHLGMVIPLQLSRPGLYSVYLRAESVRALQLPLRLWQHPDFIAHDEASNLVLGLFFGMLLVVLLYNFFLFVVLRSHLYLLFSLFMTPIILFHCQEWGLGLRFLWPGQWKLNESVWLLSGMASIFFGTLFAEHFLHLEQRRFPLLKPMRLVRWLALVAGLIAPWLSSALGVFGLVLLSLLTTALLLVAVFYHYQPDNRPVQLFTLGWVLLVAGVLAQAGCRLGLLPSNPLTENALSVATLAQFMLFSMALSYRLNHEKALSLQQGQLRLTALREASDQQAQQLRAVEMQRNADAIALQLQVAANERLALTVDDTSAALDQTSQRLRELSRLDPLTGLYNRNHFNERLREEYERGARALQPLSLILLAVDQDEEVQERWGNKGCDQLLRQVAESMAAVTRHHCASLFQFEERIFAVLLPGQPAERALAVAEMIRAAVAQQPFVQAGAVLPISISAGVGTLVPQHGGRPESWVRLAQQALARAWQQDGDRVCVEEWLKGASHG